MACSVHYTMVVFSIVCKICVTGSPRKDEYGNAVNLLFNGSSFNIKHACSNNCKFVCVLHNL